MKSLTRNLWRGPWARDRRGNVAIYFAVASFAVAGLSGGALTMARLNGAGGRLQDLADGAALAAAAQAQNPRASDAEVENAAMRFGRTAMDAGPHEAGPAVITVKVSRGAPTSVSVTFDQEVRTILAGFVGRDRIAIRRRATAVVGPERKTCLHVLEPSAPSALALQGAPSITAPDCVVQVDSTAPGALKVQGAAAGQAQATYVAGPASETRRWSPAPLWRQPAQPDPLKTRIVWPLAGECIDQPENAAVLKPGVYCNGLRLAGVRLDPGLYVVKSGGVSVSKAGAQGRDVTLVLLDPEGELNIAGNAPLRLAAPATGEWAGIAMAAKPGAALPTSTLHGVLDLDGTLYLPGHRLTLQGNARVGGVAATREVIVRQLLARGTPDLDLAGGHPSGVHGAARLSR